MLQVNYTENSELCCYLFPIGHSFFYLPLLTLFGYVMCFDQDPANFTKPVFVNTHPLSLDLSKCSFYVRNLVSSVGEGMGQDPGQDLVNHKTCIY